MVFRERRQVVMPAALYAYERNFIGIDLLQALTVADGNNVVFGAMEDIGMAVDMTYPPVGAQLVAQDELHGKKGEKAFHHLHKIVIRGVEDEVTGLIVGGYFGRKAAADAAAVHQYMVFGILDKQLAVYILHVTEYIVLAAFARAFAETAVIHQHHIVIVAVKIAGVFGPAFYAAGIAMKIQDQSLRIGAVKVQAIDAHPGRHIKI